jgi:Flp pilus assembly protein TadG
MPLRNMVGLRWLYRLLKRESGGALVELAVGIPILLLLAAAVGDYARVYYMSITVASAAKAGVHYGVAYDGDADSMTVSARRDAGTITLDTITAGQYCVCPSSGVVACGSTPCSGSSYGLSQVFDTVRVRKDVSLIVRLPGLPAKFTLITTAVLRQR